MKSKDKLLKDFDPNGVGIQNGHFIGLPFHREEADLILLGVPWDLSCSFGQGTSSAPKNILEKSPQLDLYDEDFPGAWRRGIFLDTGNEELAQINIKFQERARKYIDYLESGKKDQEDFYQEELAEFNSCSEQMIQSVYEDCHSILREGKLLGLVGGDHSTPLGFLKALAEKELDFGILQIDAHMDLRESYEGFTHSHASIFYNALKIPEITSLVQIGVRDFCDSEYEMSMSDPQIVSHSMRQIRDDLFKGNTWEHYLEIILADLPQKVYLSLDIDALDQTYCPNTGTPVPGGFEVNEIYFLLKKIVESGRRIIGFDLSEVAGLGNDWDGNVGARVLYKLAGALLSSNPLTD